MSRFARTAKVIRRGSDYMLALGRGRTLDLPDDGQSAGAGLSAPFGALDVLTVLAGNSIPGYSRYETSGPQRWGQGNELMFARRLAGGGRLRFQRVTANNAAPARHDAYGNFSHSGATCEAIVDGWIASGGWFDSLETRGLRPDLVIIPDIILNDLTGGAPGNVGIDGPTAVARLERAKRTLRARWPNVRIWWWTVRGSSWLATPAKITATNVASDWMVAQDDGVMDFTTDLRGVWGALDAPDSGTTQGEDGVHPSVLGAFRVGRLCAADLPRICSVPARRTLPLTVNPWMAGSSAVNTGTATGTAPTGFTHSGPNATNSCVATATGDATTLQYTVAGTSDFLGVFSSPTRSGLALADTVKLGGRVVVDVLSGPQFLRSIGMSVLVTYSDATTEEFFEAAQLSGGNNPEFRVGDRLQLNIPEFTGAATKTIASVRANLYPAASMTNGAGAFSLRVSELSAFTY